MKTVSKKNTSGLLSILSTKIKRYRNKAPGIVNIKRSLAEVRPVTVQRAAVSENTVQSEYVTHYTLLPVGLGHC